MLEEIRNNYGAIKKYADMHNYTGYFWGVATGITITITSTAVTDMIQSKFEVSDLANYGWPGMVFGSASALYIAFRSHSRKDSELDKIKKHMKTVEIENKIG